MTYICNTYVTSKFHIALCCKIIPSLMQVLGQSIPNPCCSFARELKYFGYVAIPICSEVHADGRFCASSTEIQCHTTNFFHVFINHDLSKI